MTTYSFDYCSDLHLEFDLDYGYQIPTDKLFANQQSDNLIIAGDLCVVNEFRPSEVEYTKQEFEPFVADVMSRYKNVYLVLGNHDHWGHRIDKAWQFYHQMFPQFTILDSHCNIISDYDDNLQIVGSTLWCNIETQHFEKARRRMNDYCYIIKDDVQTRVTPEDTTKISIDTMSQFVDVISDSNKKTLVITHHIPVDATREFPYKECAEAYFSFTYEKTLQTLSDNIVGWVHGHIHARKVYNQSGINFYCNPRGYLHQGISRSFQLQQLKFEI